MTGSPSVAHDHPPTVPRVVVVDDDLGVRVLVRHMLGKAGMEFVGEAHDGAEAVAVVGSTQPDVVVLDLEMPTMSGDEALPHLLHVAPSAMVVIFSGDALDDAGRQKLLNMGAFACYDKANAHRLDELLAEDLVRFRRVLQGEDSLPSWMSRS